LDTAKTGCPAGAKGRKVFGRETFQKKKFVRKREVRQKRTRRRGKADEWEQT